MSMNEKRRTSRKLVALSALVTPDSASMFSPPLKANVLDLNRTGALIHAAEPLCTGERCTITLVANDGTQGQIDARIVWVELDASGEYRAGVAFRNLSPDEEYLVALQMMRNSRQAS